MPTFRAAPLRKPRQGGALESSEAIAAHLEEMERKMERLRALYESFFMGVEKRPPQMPRQELNRLMLELQQVPIRNAALRFRFQSLAQRWSLLTTYWNRTLREIESGTYRRDLQKAYRRIAARGEPLTETEATALGIPAGRAKAFVAQQNRRLGADGAHSDAKVSQSPGSKQDAPRTPAEENTKEKTAETANVIAPEPVTRAAAAPPVDVDLAALHRSYVEAHTRLGLPGPPPTEERIRTKLVPQLERLRAAHPGSNLSAVVVAENGRLIIRAKPIA
jgi:hypothetical protein